MEMSHLFTLSWFLSLEPYEYRDGIRFTLWIEPEEMIALIGNTYPNQFMTSEDFRYVSDKGVYTPAGREYHQLNNLRRVSLHLQSLNSLIHHIEKLSKHETLDIRKEPPIGYPNDLIADPIKARLELIFAIAGDHSYSFQLDARYRDLPKTDIKVEDFLGILSTLSQEITKALKARE
jgi:hypothetical protein